MGVKKTCVVKFIRKGDTGDKGEQGAVLRGPQAWADCVVGYAFKQGAPGEAWLDVVLYNDYYYYCKKSHVKTSSNYPGSTTAENQGLWQLGDSIGLVATRILLAQYALVKNLGVEAIDMRDGNGNVIFQAKDGNVTCKTGTFDNVNVRSGNIGGFSLTDNWLEAAGENYGALISAATFKLFAEAFNLGDGTIDSNFEVHPYAVAYSYYYIMQRLVSSITPPSGASDYSVQNRANILMYLSAKGQKLPTYGSSGQHYGGNFVAWCDGGMFAGLRPHLRHLSSNATLAATDNVIVVNNSSAITLTLPHNAEIGQEYEIWHTSSTTLTIQTQNYSVRKYIYRLTKTAGFGYSVESGSQEIMRFKFTPGLYNSSSNEKGCWLMVYYGKSA